MLPIENFFQFTKVHGDRSLFRWIKFEKVKLTFGQIIVGVSAGPFSAEVLGGLVLSRALERGGGLSPQETLWLRTPHLKQVIFSLISAMSKIFYKRDPSPTK